MAYKTFTNGTLADATEVQTYLMNQSIATFSSTAARNSSITSPQEGQVAYVTANNTFTYYDGAAWQAFLYPEWITYTPTINNVTLGSGYTLSAVYTQIGDLVIVNFSLLFGATTAVTGDVNISMPVNHANTNRSGGAGNAVVVDASPLTRYHGNAYLSGTPSFAFVRVFNAAGTYVTETALAAAVPMAAWAVNDLISFTIVYQAA